MDKLLFLDACVGILITFVLIYAVLAILALRSVGADKNEYVQEGVVYGYKILYKNKRGIYTSPYKYSLWVGSRIRADHVPSPDNFNGIYIVKEKNNPELDYYKTTWCNWFLVRVKGYGVYVEHEHGYRTEYAEIVGVEEYAIGKFSSIEEEREYIAKFTYGGNQEA